MIVFYGTYRFGRKKVGARKDFCNACERECLAEQWRSFDCGHIFWIPLLPLGSHERWHCSLCSQDPRSHYKTRKGFKILGLVAVSIFLLAFFSVQPKPEEVNFMWGARVLFMLAFLGLLYSLLRRPPSVPEDERRKAVIPLSADTCIYCHSALVKQPYLHCSSCQVRVYK